MMMHRCPIAVSWCLVLVFLCLSFSQYSAAQRSRSDEGTESQAVTLSLEHALVNNTFTPRGQISFRNTNLFLLSNTNKISSSLQFSQSELSPSDARNLQKLIENHGWYQIRIRLPFSRDSKRKTPYVVASVPACALLASDFADFIKINLDQFGNVIGVDYRTSVAECPTQKSSLSFPTGTIAFDTKVRLGFGVEGSKPLKVEHETPEAVKEKESAEKGFFAKYWMYIIPVVLMVIFGGLTAPDTGAEGGAGEGGQAQGQQAPDSGARRPAGGPRQRR